MPQIKQQPGVTTSRFDGVTTETSVSTGEEVLAEVDAPTFAGADLSGANLSGADLSYTHLSRTNLRNIVAGKTNFQFAFLSGAFLQGADLRHADLENTQLRFARYSHTTQWPEGFDVTATKMHLRDEEADDRKQRGRKGQH